MRPAERATSILSGVGGRNAVSSSRRYPQKVQRQRHRVSRELPAAGSRSRAGSALQLRQLGGGYLPCGMGPDGFENILDVHVAALETAGRDRA